MDITSWFVYVSNKQIKVDIWQMGLLYYVISIAILVRLLEFELSTFSPMSLLKSRVRSLVRADLASFSGVL